MSTPAVAASDLRKRFEDARALEGVSFEAQSDEFFGLVGPSGVGETTTLRTLATLLDRLVGSVQR